MFLFYGDCDILKLLFILDDDYRLVIVLECLENYLLLVFLFVI